MSHRLQCVVLACVLAASATAHADDEVQLFNGQNLDGWTAVSDKPDAKAEDTWSVEESLLTCTGRPAGYLRTSRDDFENYTLTLQWRWKPGTDGGNNGVLVHSTTPNALGVWPKSLEVQLGKDNAGDFWVIGTTIEIEKSEGRIQGRRHLNLTDGSEKAVGEWNEMEITCKGDEVTVRVNGDLVNHCSKCSQSKGAICLQSEGAPIQFKDVVLRPLAK